MPLTSTNQHNWFPDVYLTTQQVLVLEKFLRENSTTAPPELFPLLVDIAKWRREMPQDNAHAALPL